MKNKLDLYAIITFELNFFEKIAKIEFRSLKKSAIECAVQRICANDFTYENHCTEVWKKDDEGLYGRKGLPIWCTKTSGNYDAVVNNKSIEQCKTDHNNGYNTDGYKTQISFKFL